MSLGWRPDRHRLAPRMRFGAFIGFDRRRGGVDFGTIRVHNGTGYYLWVRLYRVSMRLIGCRSRDPGGQCVNVGDSETVTIANPLLFNQCINPGGNITIDFPYGSVLSAKLHPLTQIRLYWSASELEDKPPTDDSNSLIINNLTTDVQITKLDTSVSGSLPAVFPANRNCRDRPSGEKTALETHSRQEQLLRLKTTAGRWMPPKNQLPAYWLS